MRQTTGYGLFLLAALSAPATAEVFKCMGTNGVVAFQDRPCAGQAAPAASTPRPAPVAQTESLPVPPTNDIHALICAQGVNTYAIMRAECGRQDAALGRKMETNFQAWKERHRGALLAVDSVCRERKAALQRHDPALARDLAQWADAMRRVSLTRLPGYSEGSFASECRALSERFASPDDAGLRAMAAELRAAPLPGEPASSARPVVSEETARLMRQFEQQRAERAAQPLPVRAAPAGQAVSAAVAVPAAPAAPR